MWNMTVVAIGFFPVRAVIPGGVLRGHDMTIHAGGWIVGQVGAHPGDVNNIEEQTSKNP
jgi:hypothetical protein